MRTICPGRRRRMGWGLRWRGSSIRITGTMSRTGGRKSRGERRDALIPARRTRWTPRIVIRFSEDVGTTLQAADLVVTRLSDNQALAGLGMVYDPASYTATWTLPANL